MTSSGPPQGDPAPGHVPPDPGDPQDLDPGVADGLVGDLTRWLAAERADAAAAGRARERWLRQQATEEALFAGVLLDLAERASVVVVQGVGGRTHRGRVRAVGEDFVALRTERSDVILPYDAIASVRPQGAPPQGADRARALDLGLAEAAAALVADRPRVLIVVRDGTGLAGDLLSAGRDVLVLRVSAESGGWTYVPLASVAEINLGDGA